MLSLHIGCISWNFLIQVATSIWSHLPNSWRASSLLPCTAQNTCPSRWPLWAMSSPAYTPLSWNGWITFVKSGTLMIAVCPPSTMISPSISWARIFGSKMALAMTCFCLSLTKKLSARRERRTRIPYLSCSTIISCQRLSMFGDEKALMRGFTSLPCSSFPRRQGARAAIIDGLDNINSSRYRVEHSVAPRAPSTFS